MAGDASWASVALNVHGIGAQDAVVAIDTSPTPKTSTAAGNAKISIARLETGEMRFDGNGDYFWWADHADFELANGNFTIETKVYLLGYASSSGGDYGATLVCKDVSGSRGFNLTISGTAASFTTLKFAGFSDNTTSTIVSAAFAFALNTEYTVRAVRSGNLVYLFVDGVLLNPGGTAFAVNIQNTTSPLKAGALFFDAGVTYNYYLNGYMRELRITKGVARSTANYVVDAEPFPDGLGQVSGTVVDAAAAACARLLRAYRRDTGALVTERYSGAADAKYNSVVLSLHGDVNPSGAFLDSSFAPKTVTVVGATISTAQARHGKGSMLFNGTSNYLSHAAVQDFQLGALDFTGEADVRLGAIGAAQKIMGVWSDVSGAGFSWKVQISNTNRLEFVYSTTGGNFFFITATSGALSAATWYHLEVVRVGTTIYLFVEGVLVGSGAIGASTIFTTSSAKLFEVGRDGAGPAGYFNGHMANLRLTKGVGRHTAGFTALTDRHPDKVSGALGNYSFYTSSLDELDIICLDDTAGDLENDVIHRAIPA